MDYLITNHTYDSYSQQLALWVDVDRHTGAAPTSYELVYSLAESGPVCECVLWWDLDGEHDTDDYSVRPPHVGEVCEWAEKNLALTTLWEKVSGV